MEFYEVSLEAHRYCATIYVMGLLSDPAARHAGSLIDLLPSTTSTVRLDLRAVEFIDPAAFVSIARSLNRWREVYRGRVAIEFPARSRPRASHLHLLHQRNHDTIVIKKTQTPATTGIFDEGAIHSAIC